MKAYINNKKFDAFLWDAFRKSQAYPEHAEYCFPWQGYV
jgi:hypothetical protein